MLNPPADFRLSSGQSAPHVTRGAGPAARFILVLASLLSPVFADDRLLFFESRIRPVLVKHCDSCHSASASTLQGGLRLDLRAGWQQGGDSGAPAIIPGNPDSSPLLQAVRHVGDLSAMPPNQPKLPADVVADLATWIRDGAVDPRDGTVTKPERAAAWEAAFQQRSQWWSLQPLSAPAIPGVNSTWLRNSIDNFIASQLLQQQLQPAPPADRRTLARRLSFAITGLPPHPDQFSMHLADTSPTADDTFLDTLLNSPHFGERWARHWMDIVHYADTHGYEWDVPAKNAWRYRDYLIRAFNSDVPYNRFVQEQLAGDLLPPRINPETNTNEAAVGPAMLRLGERRHGDNSAAEGVTQEAVANMIDTIGKGFLATTLACAQCHDHKLDAIEQRDYYSLAGMLMSTRYSARPIDVVDPNLQIIEQLRGIRTQLRAALARRWLAATQPTPDSPACRQLSALAADGTAIPAFPVTLASFSRRGHTQPVTADEFHREHQQRIGANTAGLTLLADFTRPDPAAANGWRWEGFGMQHGLVASAELAVAEEGDQALRHLLPAGRWSYIWSPRLAGSLQSPAFDPLQPVTFSLEATSGKFSSQSFIVDRALNPERLQFPSRPFPVWQTLTAGRFDSLEGTVDAAPRRVYFELATKSLNNYFPPRIGYGGVSEAEVADQRSWFGVSRIFRHAPGKPPQDDLARFQPLFTEFAAEPDWNLRLTRLLHAAVRRWEQSASTPDDVPLLNDALQTRLLPTDLASDPETARLITLWRELEQKIQPDQTAGSAAEWHEGHDERLAVRGVYTDLADTVPRAALRLFPDTQPLAPGDSGRLRWTLRITDPANPLFARVWVNRVWHFLFGSGLVRTTDDFGHLGELPSHPELLDHLTTEFIRDGWSTKRLIRRIVSSATWRQSSIPDPRALETDPENRLWHHHPLRRLEAEAIRDAILAVSGRLDPTLYGPPIEPWRTAEDASKRLLRGPLDGNGRRSLYLEMTLMEPPRFLALFNQPLPRQTNGRRDVTNTPDQALALLNDPFVHEAARIWSLSLIADQAPDVPTRAARMLETALSRPGSPDEIAGLTQLLQLTATLRSIPPDQLLSHQPSWQDAAHAVLNLKEFLYVP
ncbi:MAG: PSD1 and planctomycete cytochrome C domain-containing protein [Planctomycetota bacterium]